MDKNTTIVIRVTKGMKATLQYMAGKYGVTVSFLVRRIIQNHIDKSKQIINE